MTADGRRATGSANSSSTSRARAAPRGTSRAATDALGRRGGPAGRRDGARLRRHDGLRARAVRPRASRRPGLDVLLFDYRGFGLSGGTPRQTVSVAGQLADYRAAIAAAAELPGTDRTRVVLWGVSLSGATSCASRRGGTTSRP
jgi:fermentation-respiration switch protein FrsA (DUF1100 family)